MNQWKGLRGTCPMPTNDSMSTAGRVRGLREVGPGWGPRAVHIKNQGKVRTEQAKVRVRGPHQEPRRQNMQPLLRSILPTLVDTTLVCPHTHSAFSSQHICNISRRQVDSQSNLPSIWNAGSQCRYSLHISQSKRRLFQAMFGNPAIRNRVPNVYS